MSKSRDNSFNSRRRLTRDWRNIISEKADKPRLSTRRTFMDEIWFGSESIDFDQLGVSQIDFVTGSSYEGQCSRVGMDGVGTYTFPHGIIYEGQFKDGMFHGRGILIYPQGQALNCVFENGKMVEFESILSSSSIDDDSNALNRRISPTSDDSIRIKTEYNISMSMYCKPPDRRFARSYSEGLRPATMENLTNVTPTKQLPDGCYDVIDGFYNPKTKWVHSFKDAKEILYMIPLKHQNLELIYENDRKKFMDNIPDVPIYRTEDWILKHCRNTLDENVGYKPEFYEYWFSGSDKQRETLNMRTVQNGGKFRNEEVKCEIFSENFLATTSSIFSDCDS